MLQDLNGKTCEIVTGVTIGMSPLIFAAEIAKSQSIADLNAGGMFVVYPTLGAPGYKLQYVLFLPPP
jgi:hypothetical protein